MIDLNTIPLGNRLGCKYTYSAGAFGVFSNLSSKPSDGRKVKDPLIMSGSYFEGINVPDPKMLKITSKVVLATYRTYGLTDTVLATGIESTSEEVDFSLYKSVVNFSSAGSVSLTAIPKDQLIVTKDMINISDYVTGINSIKVALSNLFCKFAITLDGTTYKTYDSTNNVWVNVDLTQPTDTLKTTMSDYTILNGLTVEKYASLALNGKLGLALLIGIDGTDTTKTYSIDSITLDYVGTDDSSPTIQHFNFVFSGYTCNGNPKFVADRVIQPGINYSTLYNAKVVEGRDKITIANSEIGYDCYMRLIDSGISSAYKSEYDTIINSDIIPRNGKTIPEFWNTNITSLTRTLAGAADSDGSPVGTNNIVARGGADAGKYTNVPYGTNSDDHGFRPVMIVDIASIKPTRPGSALTLVSKTSDLGPGKGITCEYSTTAVGALGKFNNLGKATKGYLSDYTNSLPNGTFVFNFVGYTKEGKIKLLADRVIQTNISADAIYAGNTPLISSGMPVTIDGQTHTLRMPNALVEKTPGVKGGEYDSIVNNSIAPTKTIEHLWHTSKTLSWTNAQSVEKSKFLIVKGLGEESGDRLNQRHSLYTDTADNIGFRPLLIIEPNVRMEGLTVTPKVGYEKQDYAKQIIITGTLILADGEVGEYALLNKSDNSVISDYSKTNSRTIEVTSLTAGATTTIKVVEKTSGLTVVEFDVYRDALYRNSTTRVFGNIYSGYRLTNIQIDPSNNAAKPIASINTIPVVSNSSTFVSVGKDTNKVTFS